MKKFLLKMASAVLALACLFSASACGGGSSEQKPYDHLVTFNYNVGNMEVKCEDQFLGVKNNSLIGIQPGYSDSFRLQEIKGYFNEGWYLAETDGEGNVVVDENGRVKLGEKWNFETDRVSSNVVLYANLLQQSRLLIVGGDETITFDGEPGEKRKEPTTSKFIPKKAGYTFYGYYEDEAYTTPFVFPYTFVAGDKTVYAKFIEGSWSIVDTASEFISAYSSGKNIYLDADIDFTGASWIFGLEYGGEIRGNGHALKNITCKFDATMNTKSGFGLFGTLKSTAKISNLTVENASATYSCNYVIVGMKAALFAYKAETGATIENVTVTGSIAKGKMHSKADVVLSAFIAEQETGVVITDCNYTGITVNE